MGNTRSATCSEPEERPTEHYFWWPNNQSKLINKETQTTSTNSDQNENERQRARSPTQLQRGITEKLDEFKLEFERKHEKRRQILAQKRKEMQDLREEVVRLRQENDSLKKPASDDANVINIERLQRENDDLKRKIRDLDDFENVTRKNRELKVTIAEIQSELQNLNSEIVQFEKEREEYKRHVVALKDVIKVSKEMIVMKDNQMKELKQKLDEIEKSLADKEMKILSQDIKQEYEKQLENMKNLRKLYEERQKADKKEKAELKSLLADKSKELENQEKKNSEILERIEELENENSKKYDEIKNLESNLGFAKAESRQYKSEMTVINQLFSQILLGFNNSQEIDIDTLIKHLEENHDLLQNIVVNEVSSEVASALPKVLLDLLYEINEKKKEDNQAENVATKPMNDQKLDTIEEETESQTSSLHQLSSATEIVEKLPKVWRVLIELLSHQCTPVNILTEDNVKEAEDPCYKLVETPKGPNLVLSVSQTFIRLKDLILEKKSLEKETGHLKQLNGHLESRLQDQEKRLEMVSNELSKTWHVVGKLQKQHQLLHTQEKILRYELAQKRKLLTELKEELEYSREKWLQAREKNSTTEEQWKQLRTEFASRKNTLSDDLNNSVESGYSDERECSSDDEPGYETDVSECNQKTSNTAENIEIDIVDNAPIENDQMNILGDVPNENSSDNSISLDVIQDEIADTESEELSVSEDIEPLKTDLVQNNENKDVQPSTSQNSLQSDKLPTRSLEEVLEARQERLNRLEGQCQSLVEKVTNTSNRSIAICNKLEDLHEIYGENSGNQTEGVSSEQTNFEEAPNHTNEDNQE